jgi:hypothetical protein
MAKHTDYLPWTGFHDGSEYHTAMEATVTDKGVAVSTATVYEDMSDDVARKLLDALTRYFADKDGNDE